MTAGATAPATAPAAGSAAATITPGRLWAAGRLPLAVGALVVVFAAVIALLSNPVRGGLLDPEAARPPGGQALAVLLEQRGVGVTRVPTPTGANDTTTFVPVPSLVPLADVADLLPSAGRDVVIVGADEGVLAALRAAGGPDVAATGDVDVAARQPACDLREAVVAGITDAGGVRYAGDGTGCYASGGEATLREVRHAGGRLTLVGAPDLFTNSSLDEDGNAALAIGLLSRRGLVEWVYPRAGEREFVSEGPGSLTDLLPDAVVLAALQLLLAAGWVALWRVRRLGPVVVEALPVVVRAAESVEGRAMLYRAGRAHVRAAGALQRAARDQLTVRLGLGREPAPAVLVDAVVARSRRSAAEVESLLYGHDVPDDAALVRLARDLDTLSSEVRAR